MSVANPDRLVQNIVGDFSEIAGSTFAIEKTHESPSDSDFGEIADNAVSHSEQGQVFHIHKIGNLGQRLFRHGSSFFTQSVPSVRSAQPVH